MRRALVLLFTLVVGLATVLCAPAAASSRPRTLVVDDDGAQCGPRAYASIQAAVDAAHRGDRIRICAGHYAERVVVDKKLSLIGQPAAVRGLDCFGAQASDPTDVDTAALPVIEPPDEIEAPVLRLEADQVEVAGLVIQGVNDQVPEVVDGPYSLFDAALTTDDTHAGWWIHDNLFRLNFLAAELGSDGSRKSRFDHNCLRDNEYAVANQRYTLTRARLDHNATFRSGSIGWELGWGYRGTKSVTLEFNVSSRDGSRAVYAQNGDRMTVRDNQITDAGVALEARDNDRLMVRSNLIARAGVALEAHGNDRLVVGENTVQAGGGMHVGGGNAAPRIVGNTIQRTSVGAGIFVNRDDDEAPSTEVLVRGNTVTDGTFSGLSTGPDGLIRARIEANTFSRNQRSGMLLASGSRLNRLTGNVAEANAVYGIWLLPGTQDNRITRNRMQGNGVADALDATDDTENAGIVLANQWVRNQCITDVPAGAIC